MLSVAWLNRDNVTSNCGRVLVLESNSDSAASVINLIYADFNVVPVIRVKLFCDVNLLNVHIVLQNIHHKYKISNFACNWGIIPSKKRIRLHKSTSAARAADIGLPQVGAGECLKGSEQYI